MRPLFQRGLLLAALMLGQILPLAAQSTLMTIHMNDGTEHKYYMAEYDRVYFEDNETLVVEITPTKSDRFNLAEIRKIICSEVEGLIEETDATILLSPNPSHDAFRLHNLAGRQRIDIYGLDGRMVKSVEAVSDQLIDIADLPIGIYLVKTLSSTHKIIKL